MGEHWLENHLEPDTTFKVGAKDIDSNLTTTLNYMIWRGWVERIPVLTNDDGIASGWRLTNAGQSLALTHLNGPKLKPLPTPAPSEGKSC